MFKNYSPRLIFGVMAVTCIIISPLFAIFVPMTVPDLFLTDRSYFYIYSFRTNVKLIMTGFFILAVAFAVLCWKRKIATYALSLVLLIGGLVTLYGSTSTYTAINEQEVYKRQLIGSQKMQWDSIDRVALEYVPNALGNYKFIDKSGNELIVQEDKTMATSYIYLMTSKKKIKFDEYEKK